MSNYYISQHLIDYYDYEDDIEAGIHQRPNISEDKPSDLEYIDESESDENPSDKLIYTGGEESLSAYVPYEDENGDLTIETRLKVWGGIAVVGLALSNPILGVLAGYGLAKWQDKQEKQ